jgi:hypothetical protein
LVPYDIPPLRSSASYPDGLIEARDIEERFEPKRGRGVDS